MNQRPIKSGYLQQFTIFGFRTTKYYYLEGTQFLIFEDDKTHIPDERIDLNGFMVDGTWQDNGYYTFILRNIKTETMLQFVALTYDDANEWVSKFKQAILISEYENMINEGEFQNIDQSRNSFLPSEINKQIPEFVRKQLKLYSEISKDKWTLEKSLKGMKLLSLQSHNNTVLKGEFVFNASLNNISTIFKKGDKFIDLHLFSHSVHQLDQNEYHQKVWKYFLNNQQYFIESNYIQYQFQRANSFIQTRESIIEENMPKFKTQIPNNTIKLFKILEIIHVVEDEHKCFVQYIYIVKKEDKFSIVINKFIKEQIINISILANELEIILQEITYSDIPITQSRIMTASDQFQIDDEVINDDECENKYFLIQDRLGYVDYNLPSEHPGNLDMHKKILNLNEDQKQILQQFKIKVNHLKLNDATLIRFLVARNFKINDSEQMLLKCLQWRKDNFIMQRNINDYPAFIAEQIHFLLGFSKWGHPIMMTVAMNSHPEKFKMNCGLSEKGYLEYHRCFVEDAISKMRGNIDQFVVIIDCYKLKASNIPFTLLKDACVEVFNYYPERQFRIYVINTNFLTRSCYTMLKPFLPAKTVEKLIFLGQDFEEIKKGLSKDIDEDVIPLRYGGKNKLVS